MILIVTEFGLFCFWIFLFDLMILFKIVVEAAMRDAAEAQSTRRKHKKERFQLPNDMTEDELAADQAALFAAGKNSKSIPLSTKE